MYSYTEGTDTLYVCMADNISTESFLEKKAIQANQEAENAQKVKTEFVANVTHELRTPVNGILGNVQELISLETENDKLKLLHLVERGCRDMNAIINNILDFSKLEAGKFVLENQKFQFRSLMDYIRSNHQYRITEKGLEILKPYNETAERIDKLLGENVKGILFYEEEIKIGGMGMNISDLLRDNLASRNIKYDILAIDDNFASPKVPCDLYSFVGLSADKLVLKMKEEKAFDI